jgi:solute carrier family 45 protein 1/2/4
VIWSVVLANGTVYLLSLGLPEYLTAMAWMAGPLCGIFVQPYMGVLSDNHAGKYGRRRPFMVAGTIGIMLSMLSLAFIEQIVNTVFGTEDESVGLSATLIAALVLVWALNFSIQPLQVGMRALIIDMFPQQMQSQVSAWASYWVGCGNILGAIAGSISLPHAIRLPGLTQFQCLCLIAALTLGATAFVACSAGKEDVRDARIATTDTLSGIREPFKRIFAAYFKISWTTRQVLVIQFYSWMAWFPFLYYESSYVSNLCKITYIYNASFC